MRVCFVVHQSTKEGAGRYMLDQVDQLLARGFTVYAIVPSEGPLATALAERNVRVRLVPNPWWTNELSGGVEPPYQQTLIAARTIASALREWNVDVVYTQTVVVPAGAIGAAMAGLPHIWHIHEFSYNPTGLMMGLAKPELARLFTQTSNRVYFASNAIASEWSGTLQSVETRVVSSWTTPGIVSGTPDSTDSAALALLQDKSVFVFAIVGSVHSWKRQKDAVEAVGNLLRDGLNVALLIVGPTVHTGYAEEVRQLAASQPRAERIRFCNYTEFPQRIMRDADVCVVCSDKEPFGRVTIESMAQGTPVVGSDSGGTPEIVIDGVNGLLYPTGNVRALTDALRKLATNAELHAKLAAGALEDDRFTDADGAMAPVIRDIETLRGESNPGAPVATILDRGVGGLLAQLQHENSAGQLVKRVVRKIIRPIRKQ